MTTLGWVNSRTCLVTINFFSHLILTPTGFFRTFFAYPSFLFSLNSHSSLPDVTSQASPPRQISFFQKRYPIQRPLFSFHLRHSFISSKTSHYYPLKNSSPSRHPAKTLPSQNNQKTFVRHPSKTFLK